MSSIAIESALGTLVAAVGVLLLFVGGEGAKRRSGGARFLRAYTVVEQIRTVVAEIRQAEARKAEIIAELRGDAPSPKGRRVRSAGGLLAVASRLLPARSRDRYLDEFRSELYDLAAGGAGWWQQVRYAARQFVRSVPVAMAVRASGRRRAAP